MDQNEAINSINSDLIRGHIDTIILKALQAGDRYGYDIIKEIEHKSDGQYIIKQPTLYSCLKRLEVQGFVKSYWGSKSIGGRKKYFTLTDLGRELFIRNKNDWDYSRDVINKLISDDDYSTISYEDSEPTYNENEPEIEETNLDDQPQEVTEIVENEAEEEIVEESEEEIVEEITEAAGKETEELAEESEEIDSDVEENEELIEVIESKEDEEEVIEEAVEDIVEANEEVIEEEAEISEETDLNEDEDLPLSAAELNNVQEDQTTEQDNSEDLINQLYGENSQESYLSNVGNAQYEPPQNDSIDVSDYFTDVDNEYVEDEEVASSVAAVEVQKEEKTEPHTDDAIVLPPPELTLRRTVKENPERTVFYSYNRSVPQIDENTAIIDKEYRGVINKLISDNIIESTPPEKPADSGNNVNYAALDYYKTTQGDQSQQQVKESEAQTISNQIASDTGEKIDLRTHNDKAIRAYNNKHYYYCNKLRLLQYGILFGVMLLEIILCFYFIEVLHNDLNITQTNLWIYIAAVIVAALFPISAFFMAYSDYYKRKRINYSAKNSAIFSIAVTVLLSLIVFFLNVYGGILIGDINIYLSSLIMPIVLSTNVIVNAIVFHCLYTSGKYNIEE